ncbi:MAG TPA: GntR family transcriptional regulator [Candidatus Dormibacteraeota bacterium]
MTTSTAAGTSISDHAYAELSRAIATCALPPGAPINERAEAARLGMSRTPFRQALHRLALDGLIVAVPKRGTYVAPLDAGDIRDNMVVRAALEADMARRLVTEGRPVDFAKLKRCIADQRTAARSGDWLTFLGLDEAFHLAILEAAGNPRATESARRAWIHVNRARYLMPMTTRQMLDAKRGHREILEGLIAADPERVQQAIARHLGKPLARRLEELRGRLGAAFELIPGQPA